jgi:PBSX family phage terminase large subunit
MELDIEVEVSSKWGELYNLPEDTSTCILIGGRGGMKTYEASKFIANSACQDKKRCVILRDEKAQIKDTILNEIWARYNTANEDGVLDQLFTKNEFELKDKATGEVLIYTRGFRASDSKKTANLKGPSDIDIAVIEEAEDIRDATKYNTFVDGLRKKGRLVIIILNTPDIGHWIVKRYFNTEHVLDEKGKPTGYFKLIPQIKKGFHCIQSSYKDNPHLPEFTIDQYEGYGDPTRSDYDYHHYMTAILGYASTGRKGQVFTKVKQIKLADYMSLNLTEFYGQDFGTASPAATIGCKFEGNTVYARLINYKPLPVLEIAKLFATLKLNDRDRIVCDYAEPNSISKLKNGFKDLDRQDYITYPALSRGFFAVECPSKDLQARISLMQGLNIYVVEEHGEAWDEINNYVYAQDKYGNYTDTPVDDYNHFLDALGYVIDDQRGRKKMFGI